MTLRITPVPSEAAAALALLHRDCFPDDPWGEPAIRRILGLFGAFGFVAWQADDPIGFVLVRDLGEEAEILSLGVTPSARRAGAAQALLDAAFAEARRRAAKSVVLEVAENNVAARALYARLRFIGVGRRPRYYRTSDGPVDALILRRSLD